MFPGCVEDILDENLGDLRTRGFSRPNKDSLRADVSLRPTRYFLGQYYYAARKAVPTNILTRKVLITTSRILICREWDRSILPVVDLMRFGVRSFPISTPPVVS